MTASPTPFLPAGVVPDTYYEPMQTALGPAWPRPKIRALFEDMESCQRRMDTQRFQMMNARRNSSNKRVAEERFEEAKREYRLAELEHSQILAEFQKCPATKEQFKKPQVALSECHDAYVRPGRDGKNVECVECGVYCKTYVRMERENWPAEYAEAMRKRKERAEAETRARAEVAAKAAAAPSADSSSSAGAPPLSGGFLIR